MNKKLDLDLYKVTNIEQQKIENNKKVIEQEIDQLLQGIQSMAEQNDFNGVNLIGDESVIDNKNPKLADVLDKILTATWKSEHGSGYSAEIRRVVDDVIFFLCHFSLPSFVAL